MNQNIESSSPLLGEQTTQDHGEKEASTAAAHVLQNEPQVHLVKIHLCDLCLAGEGEECHTPGCALWLHNSPGLPIHPALYEIVQEKEGA